MPAAKKATAAKKAPAKKAAAAPAVKENGRTPKQIAAVVKLRKSGKSIAEIAEELGRDSVSVGVDFIYGTEERAGQPITAARVKKDRDSGMGWIKIAARYSEKGQANVTKAQVQKLYKDGGGDVSAKPEKPAKATAKATKATKEDAPAKKAAGATKKDAGVKSGTVDPDLKSIFDGEEDKETVTKKIEGKTVTLNRGMTGESYKVGSVKAVGKSGKMGGRAVQFFDARTGGERTVLLADIVKVSR